MLNRLSQRSTVNSEGLICVCFLYYTQQCIAVEYQSSVITMNIATDDNDSHGDQVKGQQYRHLLSGTLFAS